MFGLAGVWKSNGYRSVDIVLLLVIQHMVSVYSLCPLIHVAPLVQTRISSWRQKKMEKQNLM